MDYSNEAREEVAKSLWGKPNLPIEDYRGGPFYSYFYGIHKSSCEYILHLDSVIILGGSSSHWCADAMDIYKSNPRLLFIKPLSGPSPTNEKKPQQFINAKMYKDFRHSYLTNTFTNRSFLCSKSRLSTALKP